MVSYLRETGEGVELLLLVQPRAARTRILGEHDGRLKIALATPPVEGAANDALVELISEKLHVARKSIRLAQGETSRRKRMVVIGARGADVQRALEAAP